MENESIVISNLEKLNTNESIVIYEGEYNLLLNDKRLLVNGLVSLKWLPNPNIEFTGIVNDGVKGLNEFMGVDNVEITLPNGFKGSALLTSINMANYFEVSGVLNSKLDVSKDDSNVDKISFAIVNFRNNNGIYINGSNMKYSGRLIFEYGDYKVTIDKRENHKQIYEDLKKQGGYCITHFAELKRKDNKDFDVVDVENIIESLIWLLSFSSGRQIGFCYFLGVKDDECIFEKYQTPIINNWRDISNWYPIREVYNNLGHIFVELVDKLQDELWGKVLKNIFTWYFDGLRSTYIENKIVSIQIALENIAWTYIVEDKEIMDGQIFDSKLRTSDKLRLLLYELDIPRELPKVEGLNFSNNKFKDGVHLFTDMRNDIVHPKKKSKLESDNWKIKYRVWQLGVKYLELSILRVLGYKGKYYNFLKDEVNYKEISEVVPWSNEEEYRKLITGNS
ncbi:hypothetical protein [Ureibacillus chungkukjangi]|uniref:YopA central domain-containing protein n=1 Tax=Ureibacillus chungkukjangi TaxID=1202712 RepID=A0A318TC84_9BACL|nr:hypothetical protein [Ureibacillus chungkukjangi]PYF02324.1 hypothetical protein BJ095_1431 [Ureibacillus chungkukjangi]